MRIALLTDGIFPYVIGGMQKHSFFLAKELARLGHTVYLFHYNESNFNAGTLEFFNGEEKRNIKPFLIGFPHRRYFPFHYLYESHLYSEHIYRHLEPLLPQTDFIIAQGFCAWALLKKKHGAKTGAAFPPVAVHFHGLEMFQRIPSFKAAISRYALQWAVKKNLSMTDYTISYGGKITGIMSRIADRAKIWEVPAGVEEKWLNMKTTKNDKKKTRFVFVGRYERRKGIRELNMALKSLLQQPGLPAFSFDFIGDIPGRERIADAEITYHGKISSETEIQKILSGCDVLVCPSYAEGMPNVILEAMACRLAVIATDRGAVSLLVDESTGWLIERPSPGLVAGAMMKAMEDKGLEEKKNNAAEKIRRDFMIGKVTQSLVGMMEAAAGKR
ncbi:MAG: glycosyltransferase family 4 protein [Bacteroidia bacterium]|nr:glycosyltransferase family 4 protein [Bacteroidia bacterium]